MSKNKKINPSWERTGGKKAHSPEGVKAIREAVRYALVKKYSLVAQSMWRYEFNPPERFEDFKVLSEGLEPERILARNGYGIWFESSGGQMLFLPGVMDEKGVNIYGRPVAYHPVPVGWYEGKEVGAEVSQLMDRTLVVGENCVVMKNDLFGTGDMEIIEQSVNMLVDCVLTLNQLVLLSRSPMIFRVSTDTELTAHNLFKSIANLEPVVYVDKEYEEGKPIVEPVTIRMDTGLMDVMDRFESELLDSLGVNNVPVNKRAQMSVNETTSNNDKIQLVREAKFKQRQMAIDQMNKLFNLNCTVHSVIDEMNKEEQLEANTKVLLQSEIGEGEQ